jgi:hypothetical protein
MCTVMSLSCVIYDVMRNNKLSGSIQLKIFFLLLLPSKLIHDDSTHSVAFMSSNVVEMSKTYRIMSGIYVNHTML